MSGLPLNTPKPQRPPGTRDYRDAIGLLGNREKPAVAIFTFAALCESIVTLTLYPVISIGTGQISPTLRWWFERFESLGIGRNGTIAAHLAVFIAGGIVFSWSKWTSESMINALKGEIEALTRSKLALAINAMPWAEFSKNGANSSTHSLISCCELLSEGARNYIFFIGCMFSTALLALTLTLLSPVFGALSIALIATVFLSLRRSRRRATQQVTSIGKNANTMVTWYGFFVSNLKYSKSSGFAKSIMSRIAVAQADAIRDTRLVNRNYASQRLLYDVAAFTCIAIVLGSVVIFSPGKFSKTTIFLAVLYRLMPRIVATNLTYQSAHYHLVFLQFWKQHLRQAESVREADGGKAIPPKSGDLSLKDVTFRYPGAGKDTLRSVNVSFPANTFTVIIGSSGSGKSTLLDLLTGLIKPQSGEISFNGQALDSFDLSLWRGKIGLVMQQVPLIHGSVIQNIALQDPNPNLRRVEECARLANADGFIQKLQRKYDTVIGENLTLSGGESQRLALARALYSNPDILILDEPTSALDSESEAQFIKSLAEIKKNLTVIMSTHRMQCFDLASHVIVMDDGKIDVAATVEQLVGENHPVLNEIFGDKRQAS